MDYANLAPHVGLVSFANFEKFNTMFRSLFSQKSNIELKNHNGNPYLAILRLCTPSLLTIDIVTGKSTSIKKNVEMKNYVKIIDNDVTHQKIFTIIKILAIFVF